MSRTLAMIEGDDQRDMLEKKLRRKLSSTKASSDYELRSKLLRYALSQGYDYDMSIDVIDLITKD